MEKEMVEIIADNIISPLGFTTDENYQAIKAGKSMLRRFEGKWGIPEPFTASLFTDEQWSEIPGEGKYTRFERLLILTVSKVLEQVSVDVTSDRVLFVFSTTKGNVELLEKVCQESDDLSKKRLIESE